MIDIQIAQSSAQIQGIKALLEAYAKLRNHDAALGNFQKELKELPGKYAPPSGQLLIAYVEGKPAGCVAFQQIEVRVCEMKRLFVSKRFQGLGIGKQLVSRLIAEAKEAGYDIMRLDTHPWMTTAQNLYQGFGFYEIEAYNDNPTIGIRFFELNL